MVSPGSDPNGLADRVRQQEAQPDACRNNAVQRDSIQDCSHLSNSIWGVLPPTFWVPERFGRFVLRAWHLASLLPFNVAAA